MCMHEMMMMYEYVYDDDDVYVCVFEGERKNNGMELIANSTMK